VRASTYPLVDADEAASLVLERTQVLGVERRSLDESAGRVLAEDLIAPSALPAFPSSAVDGYAVRSVDAGRTLRVIGESAAGRPLAGPVGPREPSSGPRRSGSPPRSGRRCYRCAGARESL